MCELLRSQRREGGLGRISVEAQLGRQYSSKGEADGGAERTSHRRVYIQALVGSCKVIGTRIQAA